MPRSNQSAPKRPTVTIEGAEIIYHRWAGTVNEWNKEGKKSVSVYIPDDLLQPMIRDGWHINYTNAEEGEEPRAFINCKINFAQFPPRIIMVTSSGMQQLTDKSIGILDDADIANLDISLVGNPWERGISCYVTKAYVTINEDELDKKYGYAWLGTAEEGDD